MYFQTMEIENIGPIEHVLIEFPKINDRPKPVIIVGENGAGKSILLSHLVNSLIVGRQGVFDDGEVELGKVYKYRSPSYIQSGKDYSYSSVKIESGIEVQECQLNRLRPEFEKEFGYLPARIVLQQLPPGEASVFTSTFNNQIDGTKIFFKKQCCLYFPVNRFEDPAWLNIENLKSKTNYSDLKHISRFSNRSIVSTSPLKANKDWLLDLLFDRQTFEIQTHQIPLQQIPGAQPIMVPMFGGYSGTSTKIYESVLQILKVILRDNGNIRLGAGTRKNRQIAIMKDERPWVPNLFQLSTGEVQLLNLFLTIVRDYDLSEGQFNGLADIKGVVIIDEIDSHLHTVHQKEVLPELIASFPNVQFIITTHSPLFLIGMEEKFGENNFSIFNMPNGEIVSPTDFSEFNAAYEAFKETKTHRDEIRAEIERNSTPIVFVEGDYDVRYLNRAAQLLDRSGLLARVRLKDGDGFGNLDKIWKSYNNSMSDLVPNKIFLVYDCDTKKQDSDKGLIYKRVIPSLSENPISIGIENLFSTETIEKIENHCPQFIDTSDSSIKRVRGRVFTQSASKSVNKDEKGNLCSWLCEHGTAADFVHFESIFQIIERDLGAE